MVGRIARLSGLCRENGSKLRGVVLEERLGVGGGGIQTGRRVSWLGFTPRSLATAVGCQPISTAGPRTTATPLSVSDGPSVMRMWWPARDCRLSFKDHRSTGSNHSCNAYRVQAFSLPNKSCAVEGRTSLAWHNSFLTTAAQSTSPFAAPFA
jgi:hypothetical protein